MTERRIEHALGAVHVPGEADAERRAAALAADAFAARPPVVVERSHALRAVALAAAACLALTTFALTPPGDAVATWIKRIVDDRPGRGDARPGVRALPSAGRLLVTSPAGVWIVAHDGVQRRLGVWRGAAWSPRGLFVVAWGGTRVAALDPKGNVRWALTRGAPVRGAAWSPDGFRVAYLSGATVRVVAGDGSGDARLAGRAGRALPAWSPAVLHRLAYSDADGRVRVIDTDSRRIAWRSGPAGTVLQIAWAPDGRRLVAVARDELRIFSARGRLLRRVTAAPGVRNHTLAFAPVARNPALIRSDELTGRSEVVTFRADGGPLHEHRIFSGPGRLTGLAFSPSGAWLLVGWREADQWLFLHPDDQRVVAASAVTEQFTPGAHPRSGAFPQLGGWCC